MNCEGSQFVCYFSSGAFTLRRFFFDTINPYLHLLVRKWAGLGGRGAIGGASGLGGGST